uniref:Scaffolding anchor of CK1 domain-containing protein n=1 Tax=Esox lucius TaxID=8010 RepID=A0A3P8Z2Q3_ESOLU
MAHRSQCSSAGDDPMDPNYLPPHYREEYRLAIDALVEDDVEGYYEFLQHADMVDFLSNQEIEHIRRTVQVPYQYSQPDLPYVQSVADGSSDTYWPVHSDLDVPGLDLGWPQQHHVIGPTEVTTLVNPSETDMPSIKEQARRLIKNAQQVIAVVMDIFTDVDIFSDILDAAMRHVAVYIILDEHNSHDFVSMASNCRVNLKNIDCMRVRTVSGVTYRCRSGKSFKGQMMDRFLLTDCRAVLSGNYSFMWSFEKIHRCMAHLFLGQLVTTFDEEFRILFAQSEPLIPENVHGPVPYCNSGFDSQYITDQTTLFRDPRKLLPLDSSRPVEWAQRSLDNQRDMVQKMMPLGRREPIYRSSDHLPQDIYSDKYSSQQLRILPHSFTEQGLPMILPNTKELTGSKRHSYAGGPLARHSASQLMQHQDVHSFERSLAKQSRKMQREQHYYQRPGPEPGHDQFRGHGYHPMDLYSESGYPYGIEIVPPDNYDPVLNYLSSSKLAVEIGHGSDNLSHSQDIPFAQSNSRRHSVGQPYVCQTSPTQHNVCEHKLFVVGSDEDRKTKDPSAKQGMRDWRISSFLSACDDAEDGIQQPLVNDPFEEPLNPSEAKPFAPLVSHSRFKAKEFTKTPEFRLSQPKHPAPDIIVSMATDARTTPTTPSESSSITEGDKSEEIEVKEAKREESFRRKLNPVIQRTSKLRSSLIFSSQLEQNNSEDLNLPSGQHCEETTEEDDQSRLSLTTQIFGKRRSFREPFAWSFTKSGKIDNSTKDSLKSQDTITDSGDKEMLHNLLVSTDLVSSKELPKPADEKQTKTTPSSHPSRPAKIEQPKPAFLEQSSLSNTSFIDMNDPAIRLIFFKELAAKRKAEKASESESSTGKASVKPDIPFDLEIKDPITRVEPTIPGVPINSADKSTKNPVTLKGGGLEPADTSTEKPAPSTEAQLNLFDTSIKQPAASTEASLNPAGTLNKKTAQSKETALYQSDIVIKKKSTLTEALPFSQENKTSMTMCDSLHLVKEQEDFGIKHTLTSDDLPTVFTDTEKIELKNTQNEIGSTVTSGDTSVILNRTSKQHTLNVAPKDFSLYKLSRKEPKSSDLTSSKCAAKDTYIWPPKPTPNELSVSSNPPPKELNPLPNTTSIEVSAAPGPTESSASPDSTPKDSSASPDSSPKESSTSPDSIPKESSTSPDSIPKESSTSPDSIPKESSTSPDSIPKESSTSPDSIPKESSTSPDSIPKESSISPDSIPKESSTSPDSIPKESSTSPDSIPKESSTSPDSIPKESSTSPDSIPKESSTSPDSMPKESSTSPDSVPKDSSASPDSVPKDSSASPDSIPKNSSASPDSIPKDSSASPDSIPKDSSASPDSIPKESSAFPDSVPKDSSASPGPIATESIASPGPIATESSASPGPIATDSSASPGPIATESSVSPDSIPNYSSASPDSIPKDSSVSPESIPKDSSASPDSIPKDSSASPGPIATESIASPGPIATQSSASPGPTATESSASPAAIPIKSSVSPDAIQTASSASPGPTATESSASPAAIPIKSSVSPDAIQTASSESPLNNQSESSASPDSTESKGNSQTESSVSPGSSQSESHSSLGTIATELSASPGSSQTESSTSPVSFPTESSVPPCPISTKSTASLGPSQPESCVHPGFLPTESSTPTDNSQTESSVTSGPNQSESSASPVPLLTELSALSIHGQTDSSESLGTIPTESSAFPCSNPTQSIAFPWPSQTESIFSPGSIPTESNAYPGSIPTSPHYTQTDNTSLFNPVIVESNPSSISDPAESNASHDTVPGPSVFYDLKEGKPSDHRKNLNNESCPASKGDKKAGDPETMSKTAPGQSCSPGPQSPDETKENNTTIKPESKTPPAKQAKVSQAHYHSSTANVLSSSNLRDDTKLLLEQISANSQSRTELIKESAVTDDAKQDQVDRGVSNEGEASARRRSRVIGTSRTAEDREKLLQRIENMRKEGKVYSRFEMPP